MFEYSMFHQLPVWTQTEVLARKGSFLAKRNHKGYTISLFALDTYFVEVWSRGALKISTSFRPVTRAATIMEPYLADISIEQLLER